MKSLLDKGAWIKGVAHWVDGETAFVSVAFTWRVLEAREIALAYRDRGLRVRAGGPALFTRGKLLADVAELGGAVPDAIARHNPMATRASYGCPVNCWFCIVPKMNPDGSKGDGTKFTLLPDFSLDKKPAIRHDWTPEKLRGVQRWVNRHLWRKTKNFADYNASAKTARVDSSQRRLFP